MRAYDFFSRGGKKALMQIPVGSGKSGLIAILPFGIARRRVLVIAPNLTIREELKKNLDVTNRRSCFWARCNVLSTEVMSAGPYVAVLDGKDATTVNHRTEILSRSDLTDPRLGPGRGFGGRTT